MAGLESVVIIVVAMVYFLGFIYTATTQIRPPEWRKCPLSAICACLLWPLILFASFVVEGIDEWD